MVPGTTTSPVIVCLVRKINDLLPDVPGSTVIVVVKYSHTQYDRQDLTIKTNSTVIQNASVWQLLAAGAVITSRTQLKPLQTIPH